MNHTNVSIKPNSAAIKEFLERLVRELVTLFGDFQIIYKIYKL